MNHGHPWMVARIRRGAVWHTLDTMTWTRDPDGTYWITWTSTCGRATTTRPREHPDGPHYTLTTTPTIEPGPACTWCHRRLTWRLQHLTDCLTALDSLDPHKRVGQP